MRATRRADHQHGCSVVWWHTTPHGGAGLLREMTGLRLQLKKSYSKADWTGASDHAPANGPDETRDQEPHDAGKDGAPDPHQNTTTGNPRPAASASEAHEPEPPPQKQADGDEDGATREGHGPTTKPANSAPGPEPATARTQATERATRRAAGGPENDDAQKTRAAGAARRTNRSAPEAQPTATPRPEARTAPTTEATRPRHRPGREREPQNPTNAEPLATAHQPRRAEREHEPAQATRAGNQPAHAHRPARRRERHWDRDGEQTSDATNGHRAPQPDRPTLGQESRRARRAERTDEYRPGPRPARPQQDGGEAAAAERGERHRTSRPKSRTSSHSAPPRDTRARDHPPHGGAPQFFCLVKGIINLVYLLPLDGGVAFPEKSNLSPLTRQNTPLLFDYIATGGYFASSIRCSRKTVVRWSVGAGGSGSSSPNVQRQMYF